MTRLGKKFERLVALVAHLRGPDGCPWDREQTPKKAAAYLLEETYEALEAIDKQDTKELTEELGDLLLQVIFQAQMSSEAGVVKLEEIIETICNKLERRHPHVFGESPLPSPLPHLPANALVAGGEREQVERILQNWERIKKDEGKKSILDGIPQALPSLLKAYRLGQKASRAGFDWPNAEGILEKIEEEARELCEAGRSGKRGEIEHEYGDLLLILANLGRVLDIDPENALRRATNRFIKRFRWMEEEAGRRGLDIHGLTAKQWDELWNRAKENSKYQAPNPK